MTTRRDEMQKNHFLFINHIPQIDDMGVFQRIILETRLQEVVPLFYFNVRLKNENTECRRGFIETISYTNRL